MAASEDRLKAAFANLPPRCCLRQVVELQLVPLKLSSDEGGGCVHTAMETMAQYAKKAQKPICVIIPARPQPKLGDLLALLMVILLK